MNRNRPATTGYARIAQAEEFSDDSDNDELATSHASLQHPSAPRYASITQPNLHGGMYTEGTNTPISRRPRGRRRGRSNSSGVDIKAINARLERWADEIAAKFKIGKTRGKSDEEERLEIHYSVFQAPEGMQPAGPELLNLGEEPGRMTKEQFEEIVESVRVAMEHGIHPKMITQGSSGSYFARNTAGKTVGVFKPKDEEPYAAGNPKWNKWIHRNLFPCCFGRQCLIPNLSYVSEAAAYTLDCRLRTNLVPYTDIVYLSSKSFHYPYWARRNFYRKRKPFPEKPGSFQVFLQGFSDANIFLRKHPWPDHLNGGSHNVETTPKKTKAWKDSCRPTSGKDDDDEEDHRPAPVEDIGERKFSWTNSLKQSFREELEKLVILDYIMRNTDRGLDNWMIKVDWKSEQVSIVSEPPRMPSVEEEDAAPRPVKKTEDIIMSTLPHQNAYKQQKPMSSTTEAESARGPKMTVGAIDNSLSWPWKHPDAWRSFPFGWLFLPVSLIGQPFSHKTREYFLPLLTSKQWWSETQLALRKVFAQDADFQERMFARQIAVMKGQAWNVVETLKTADHGPLELTRRARVCVWDDLVDIPVATPMRAPSAEMRRKQEAESNRPADDEMDISAANSSLPQPPQHDLLGLGSPATELPNPDRFELSDPALLTSDIDISHGVTDPDTHDATTASTAATSTTTNAKGVSFAERPSATRSNTRMSDNGPSRTIPQPRREHRRFSFSSRRNSNPPFLDDDNDLEGDLGYAAAEDMEGNQRKVIVERLETVKSKNPVFTWC